MAESSEHEMFRFKASPLFWQQKAGELKHAAELLWPECQRQKQLLTDFLQARMVDINHPAPSDPHFIFPIYMALIGFSTECLFKGIILKDNPKYIGNGHLHKDLRTHDLDRLARLTSKELSRNERIFCRQAVPYMTVKHRYPVPTAHNGLSTTSERGGHCREVFLAMYARLYPELNFVVPRKGELKEFSYSGAKGEPNMPKA